MSADGRREIIGLGTGPSDAFAGCAGAPTHVPRSRRTMVAAAIRQADLQPDRTQAGATWDDPLACMTFPARHAGEAPVAGAAGSRARSAQARRRRVLDDEAEERMATGF